MQNDFWHNAWEKGDPGWRQRKINTRLQRYWPELQIKPGARVLVPLCGDTVDLLWLAEQGFDVIGAELSELAVRRFFDDNNLPCSVTSEVDHQVFEGRIDGFKNAAGRLRIYCGDFFTLLPRQIEGIAGVYDRAATVAMSPELRTRYALQIKSLVEPGTKVLLISMSFDQDKMKGPPFSVPGDIIDSLYGEAFSIEVLDTSSGPEILGNLADRGLDKLDETVYKLIRQQSD